MMRVFCIIALLLLAACRADETLSGYLPVEARWKLIELDGRAFDARAMIHFPAEGEVVGEAPCNHFNARQTAPYPWITIEDIALTRKACPQLPAEQAFVAALSEMRLAEVSGDVLILSNETGCEMLFQRVSE